MKSTLNLRSPAVRLCVGLILATLLSEVATRAFRLIPSKEGHGAVYTWQSPPGAVPVEDRNTAMAREEYRPDRGGQWKIDPPTGTPITLYYLEWDRLETAPTMIIDRHNSELCNVAAGFRLIERFPPRQWSGPDGALITFGVAHFADPAGRDVYTFENVWLGNTGNWDVKKRSRWPRLKLAFVRRTDAARVLEAGVFSAKNEAAAWEIFRTEILSGLIWNVANSAK